MDSLPRISEPLAQLGKQLFFTKALSGELDVACATCHHPLLGGGDGLSLSVGVHAVDPDIIGPGRTHAPWGFDFDGGPQVPRNAPSTFNIVLYDSVMFHDGRIESFGKSNATHGADGLGIDTPDSVDISIDPKATDLSQALSFFPVTSVQEMRGGFEPLASNQAYRQQLVQRLTEQTISNTWAELFSEAIVPKEGEAQLVSYENIARSLAAYQQSQLFIHNSWFAYLNGNDTALTLSQKRGAELFYAPAASGGANCVACHSGDFFTDEDFHVLAIPQIGVGKGHGQYDDSDWGRSIVIENENYRYAFRTPTLLNVEVTSPYGHDGAFESLEEVVRHHLDPEKSIDAYDFTLSGLKQAYIQNDNAIENTHQALNQLNTLRALGVSKLKQVNLNDEQINDIVNFLSALTDPCVKSRECLKPWLLSTDDIEDSADGLALEPVIISLD
jgi:cytochrome c peroxidase